MSSEKRKSKYYGQSEALVWPADNPKVSKPHAKKNTRRWCKGKEGREHVLAIVRGSMWGYKPQPQCRPSKPREFRWGAKHGWHCEHEERCEVCGKRMRYSWELAAEDCPEFRPDFTIPVGVVVSPTQPTKDEKDSSNE